MLASDRCMTLGVRSNLWIDPMTHAWSQRRLATNYTVGSRPKVGFDRQANACVVFNSAGNLVVASASNVSGYTDWTNAGAAVGGFPGLLALPHCGGATNDQRYYRVIRTR